MSINSALDCPTCGRPWPERRGRICSVCEKPIGAHHKYRFVGATVSHKDCDDPTLEKLASTIQSQRRLMEELA